MRLWTLNPSLLDAPRLNGLWREGLLALAVLRGETAGYRHHPQLDRFRAAGGAGALLAYMLPVYAEARLREYKYDLTKLIPRNNDEAVLSMEYLGHVKVIGVNSGQVLFEIGHLSRKTAKPVRVGSLREAANPIFFVWPGDDKEPWEKNK